MIHIIIMFIWSFILRAIPFKKVFTVAACLLILGFGMFNYNETMQILGNGVIMVNGE